MAMSAPAFAAKPLTYGAESEVGGPVNGGHRNVQGELMEGIAAGDAYAQYALARRFDEGWQLPRNYAVAAKWYRRSARQGFAPAQFRLATLYESGLGVERNFPEAMKWYRRAEAQGDQSASLALEKMLKARGYRVTAEVLPIFASRKFLTSEGVLDELQRNDLVYVFSRYPRWMHVWSQRHNVWGWVYREGLEADSAGPDLDWLPPKP